MNEETKETENKQPEVTPEEEVMDLGTQSLLDKLRAQRQETAEETSKQFLVPGYDNPPMFAEYRLLDQKELEVIGKKIRSQFQSRGDRLLFGCVDTLLAAHIGFHGIWDGGERFRLDDNSGVPLSFDRMAEQMGGHPEDGRSALFYIFANREMSVINHAIEVQRWMGGASADLDAEFLGES